MRSASMVLGIDRSASKAEIKKAYHKAALANHPDKVPESQREAADIRFKAISEAYEILFDDQKRSLFDQYGMAAFKKGQGGPGGPGGVDMEDILAQMFGGMGGGMGGMGGGMPGFPGGARGQRSRRGEDEVQQYEVTLEELYKGKTVKFSSTKNIICSHCEGGGGKDKAKAKECGTCGGRGMVQSLQPVGPGLVTRTMTPCSTCGGAGKYFKDKDRCKKCKGARVVQAKKILELYIPRGSREGEKIALKGEADQHPDQEPGDIVFHLVETPHDVFNRAGADLQAELEVSLSEALTGVNRTVLKHLDGRGIQINTAAQPGSCVLTPEQVLKVSGEGMPHKRGDGYGDLYLSVKVQFPENGWLKDPKSIAAVQNVLPKGSLSSIQAEEADEVDFEVHDDLDEFGAGSGDARGGAEWEDEDGGPGEGVQCAQQ